MLSRSFTESFITIEQLEVGEIVYQSFVEEERKKSKAQNDDFRIFISPDPEGILEFCKRLYILLDEVYNYET